MHHDDHDQPGDPDTEGWAALIATGLLFFAAIAGGCWVILSTQG